MLPGTDLYILHRQRQAVLDTVDALMFCPVVHECPLDIFHPRYQKHIQYEYPDSHKAFDHCADVIRWNERLKKRG